MMLWMLATLLISALVAMCAAVGDRVAAACVVPRRFVWIAALIAAAAIPVIAGRRVTTASSAASSPSGGGGGEAGQRTALSQGNVAPSPAATSETRGMSVWRARVVRATAIARLADRWLLAAWLVTSLAMLVRLLVRLALLRRERRRWTVTNEFGGPVFVSPRMGPAAIGVIAPSVVVPCWFLDEDPATRALLLRHEREHVGAGDTRVLFGAAALEVLFPWNAALWWMASRLRLAIEIDCDARVISIVGRARQYGRALLAASARHAIPLPISACLQESPLQIETRIHAMTQRNTPRPLRGVVSLAALGGLVALMSAWMPWPRLRSAEAQEPVRQEPVRQEIVRQESAGEHTVREFIAAFNDPDSTRLMTYYATAFMHSRQSPAPLPSIVGLLDMLMQDRRQSGGWLTRRVVPTGEQTADYVVTERSTGRDLIGYFTVSERGIERFGLRLVPPGQSPDDPELQRELHDETPGRRLRDQQKLWGPPRDQQTLLRLLRDQQKVPRPPSDTSKP